MLENKVTQKHVVIEIMCEFRADLAMWNTVAS
jgi:hypothetical protein